MTNFLITGGAGFIGSHLTAELLKQYPDYSITIVDNLSTGRRENLASFENDPRIRIFFNDILTMPELEKLVAQSSTIFHLAAAVGVELVVHDPIQTIKTNVDGSARILDFAAKYHKRIIIASTSEVYGKSAKDNFEENDDLIIGAPTHSRWSYACSKLIDEFLLMAYHQHSQLPGTIVRFFNIVGPRQTGKYGMVIPRFVRAAVNGKPIRVFGSGKQTRCFCHVADTVRALAALPNKREAYGQIYNIGSQNSISMMQLAEKVIEILHSNSSIELIPYEQAYAKGFEDMMRRSPDTAKIKKLLGWQPERSLEDIINDVANEMRHS